MDAEDVDYVATPPRICDCGEPGIWQNPDTLEWVCDRHAPPVRDRGRCSVEGCERPAAWKHPNDGWLCLEHTLSEAS